MSDLLSLSFGNPAAKLHERVDSIVAQRQESFKGNIALEPLGQHPALALESQLSLSQDTLLAASSWAPMFARREDFPFVGLVLPGKGTASFRVGKQPLNLRPEVAGVLLSGMRHEYSGEFCSLSMLALNPTKLAHVSRAMLGIDPDSHVASMRLHEDREVPMVAGPVAFTPLLNSFYQLLDSLYDVESVFLEKLGLDDQLYRCCAWMLNPAAFMAQWQTAVTQGKPRRSLAALCEYLIAHVSEPVTLTDMELFTGLSHRSLQYAFFKNYGCSPMLWLRKQRLALAHRQLSFPQETDNVTSIAINCGFTNIGNFAKYYFQVYGRKPSETLRKYRGL